MKFSHTEWGLGTSQDIRCHIQSCDSIFVFLPYEATAFPPSQPWGGGGGTPIIFSWGCAAGTLRTLAYTHHHHLYLFKTRQIHQTLTI